jgi:AcrR family transcriptional regulator
VAQTSTPVDYRPRKIPKQVRSRKLFENILDSARELFYGEGFANVSTNQIAEAAGISVGSLYQYFSNCESIALSVYEAASVRATNQMKQKARDINSLPMAQAVEEIITTCFEIFQRDQYVLLQLIDEVPELREPARAVSFDKLIHDTAEDFVDSHQPDMEPSVIEKKAYLLEKLIVGTVRRYLEDRPDSLNSEEFIAELVSISRFYLGATK